MKTTITYRSVQVDGLELKLCDGFPDSLLDPHAQVGHQRQGVIYWCDVDVERLSYLEIKITNYNQYHIQHLHYL